MPNPEILPGKSLLHSIPASKSSGYRFGSKSDFISPLLKRLSDSIVGYQPIVRPIIGLFFRRRPADVAYLIRKVVLDAFHGMDWARFSPNLSKKNLKIIKWGNNHNSAICVPFFLVRARAVNPSSHHPVPAFVLRRTRKTVFGVYSASPFVTAGDTGSKSFCLDPVLTNSHFCSAIASAVIDIAGLGVLFKKIPNRKAADPMAKLNHNSIIYEIADIARLGRGIKQ